MYRCLNETANFDNNFSLKKMDFTQHTSTISLFFSVDRCEALQSPHYELSTTIAVYGTVVIVTCSPGYIFENGSLSAVVECQEFGMWNDTVGECQSELTGLFV